MSFSFASFFVGLASAGPPSVVTASGDVTNGTDQGEIIVDAGSGAVFAGGGNDLYLGGEGAALVDGAAGDDLLFGGGGADTLIGAAGNDGLRGGGGADVFVLGLGPGGTGADAGDDLIFDFSLAEDKISLSGRGLRFEDLVIQPSSPDSPGGAPVASGSLVTFAGGSVELVNVAPQSITPDVFLGLIA